MSTAEPMTRQQKAIVVILAFLQLTVMVDFMILAPLGAVLLDELHIDTKQFGLLVSAYALSAGVASFGAAGFADELDRKRLLLVVYTGFVVGTASCGVVTSYELLLAARIVTGVFGGIMASISLAVVVDLFPPTMRGRAMGTMTSAFAAAQVAGLPAGLALANAGGWHAPFLVLAGIGVVAGLGMAFVLPPMTAHLAHAPKQNPIAHALRTATKPAYLLVFANTVLLAGSYMLMPLLSAFFVNNLKVTLEQLPLIYTATGVVTLVMGPAAGKLADKVGKLRVFAVATALVCGVFVAWANLDGPTALWIVVLINVLMFALNALRMISAGALTSSVPALPDRGAFMSINSSIQQAAGGVVAYVGGLIVVVQADGTLAHFDTLCFVVLAAAVLALAPMWLIDRQVRRTIAT